MNRHGKSFAHPRLGKDVMAAIDSGKRPTTSLNNPRQFPPGDLFHTAISMT